MIKTMTQVLFKKKMGMLQRSIIELKNKRLSKKRIKQKQ